MLTGAEIEAALVEGSTLTEREQGMWLNVVRLYPGFYSARYPTLAADLAAATGEAAGRLRAALRKIEQVGGKPVSIDGGQRGIHYSKVEELNRWIAYGLGVLYEDVLGAGALTRPTFFTLARGGRGG